MRGEDDMADKHTFGDSSWQALRRHTAARIALGRHGVSVPTSAQLAFQLAHHHVLHAVLVQQLAAPALVEGVVELVDVGLGLAGPLFVPLALVVAPAHHCP